jgi:Tfp pilus assembly protein PilN
MLSKNAIGISINGNRVKAAYLSLIKGKVYIRTLETATLATPLEDSRPREKGEDSTPNELEKAFDISESANKNDDSKHTTSSESASAEQDNNVSIVYSLIDKFQDGRANVAINAPVLAVKYDILDAEVISKNTGLKKKIKQKLDIWGSDVDESQLTDYLKISDDKLLKIDYDNHPPIVNLIEEVNQFRAGHLNLVLMDTNELALVDLIKEIYKFDEDEISAIIYIEQDFSRVIFLKGLCIYHIAPIIHKGTTSKDVLEVIYRKIIYAQDHYFIPELNNIILASYCYRLKANKYFKQKFPYATTGYVNYKEIIPDPKFRKGGRLFSQYAIPISLAWKALTNKTVPSKSPNLLPDYLIERQKLPRLAYHGYILLFLMAITAFAFTWTIVAKNIQIKKVTQKINLFKSQIEYNKPLAQKVQYFDAQISELQNSIGLVDSFGQGYEETIEFLNQLNQSLRKTGGIWITQISKRGSRVGITGIATRREKIPILTAALGGANLKKVTRTNYLDQRVLTFQLEKRIDAIKKDQKVSLMANKNMRK